MSRTPSSSYPDHMPSPASGLSALGHLRLLLVATPALALLAGCGTAGQLPDAGSVTPLAGHAMGGQQPVAGATIQLYAAGLTGNDSAATPLLTRTILTDANGDFNIGTNYTCPANSAPVYIVASGGNPGLPNNGTNPALVLVSAIGPCGSLNASTFITINEVSTAAAAWSLAPFAHSVTQLGATSTNLTGLNNAFLTANNLADSTTGQSPSSTAPANALIDSNKIYSLANILASCVNSDGTAPCTSLFTAATAPSSTTPADTFQAALDIVSHPGNNTAALFKLIPATAAFAAGLSTAPPDWTLAVKFTGGAMDSPTGLGVDASGNIWVASYFGVASEFSPTGQPLFSNGITGSGLEHSYGLAIDAQNNVWIPSEDSSSAINGGNGSMEVFNSSGQPLSGANGYTSGGLQFPIAVAIDPNGTTWAVNIGDSSVTLLSSTGTPLSGTKGYGSPQLLFPVAVAVDASHNGWIANQSGTNVTRISPDGTQVTNFSCCNGASGIAIDQNANIWVANYYGDSVSELSGSGAVISNGYTGGGLDSPQGIAIDGAGTIWVSNYYNSTLTQLAGSNTTAPGAAISPATGWGLDSGVFHPFAVAIDASGSVWLTSYGNDSLIQLVGMATPVKTPQLGPVQQP
jgi:streptogramin lyase